MEILTREELRVELRDFAASSLQTELSYLAARLQREIHDDVLQMLRDQSADVDVRANGAEFHAAAPLMGQSSPSCSWPSNSPPLRVAASPNGKEHVHAPPVEALPALPGYAQEFPASEVTFKPHETLGAFSENGAGEQVQDTESISVQSSSSSTALTHAAGKASLKVISSHKKEWYKKAAMRMSSKFNSSQGSFRGRLLKLVKKPAFDVIVACFIVTNGIIVGIQTDYMARKVLEDPPLAFQVLEYIFAIIFAAELSMRLAAYQWGFFTMPSRVWNLYDLTIVTLQLIEIILSAVAAGLGFSFHFLRTLRLIRAVRLTRALRLIGELRTLVNSITASFRPLFWTVMLLFILAYVLGVVITHLVHSERLAKLKDGEDLLEALEIYWGSLVPAIFSLIESTTGGLDWDQVCRPLIDEVGVGVGIIYTMYILFIVLAMMNVVTGVFIESVMENSKREREFKTARHVETLFKSFDVNARGFLAWEDFEEQLSKPGMKEFFRTVDVDIAHARSLFELLDVNESGQVDVNEFIDGCLRIWSPSNGLDLRMIYRDISHLTNMLRGVPRLVERLESQSSLTEVSHNDSRRTVASVKRISRKTVT